MTSKPPRLRDLHSGYVEHGGSDWMKWFKTIRDGQDGIWGVYDTRCGSNASSAYPRQQLAGHLEPVRKPSNGSMLVTMAWMRIYYIFLLFNRIAKNVNAARWRWLVAKSTPRTGTGRSPRGKRPGTLIPPKMSFPPVRVKMGYHAENGKPSMEEPLNPNSGSSSDAASSAVNPQYSH